MSVTEDIFTRCGQILEESAVLLESGKKMSIEELQIRRRTAIIAGEASFILLQKAFITPFDREDIWDFRQASESVLEAAQEIALDQKVFLQGAAVCRELSLSIQQLSSTLTVSIPSLFSVERHFAAIPVTSSYQNFIQCGKHVVRCLQRFMLKSN